MSEPDLHSPFCSCAMCGALALNAGRLNAPIEGCVGGPHVRGTDSSCRYCDESRTIASEAERIGQSLLDLAARLPEGYMPNPAYPTERLQGDLYVSYEAGDDVWEVEFCALDPKRNRIIQDRDLNTALWRTLKLDREAAPDV